MRSSIKAVVVTMVSSMVAMGCGYGNAAVIASMKKLDQEHKVASTVDDLATLKEHAAAMRAAAQAASEQSLKAAPETQAAYQRGTTELLSELTSLDAAIAASDLPAARASLARVTELRKKYHLTLGL